MTTTNAASAHRPHRPHRPHRRAPPPPTPTHRPDDQIDSKKLIDQHYYAIASKATILTPDQLNVPADKFKGQFGLEWADALSSGDVVNAMDACKRFGCDANALDAAWAAAKKASDARCLFYMPAQFDKTRPRGG